MTPDVIRKGTLSMVLSSFSEKKAEMAVKEAEAAKNANAAGGGMPTCTFLFR